MERKLFIILNRSEIDRLINMRFGDKLPDPAPRYTDAEREQWLANDEGLYRWAQSEGINL